MTCAARARSHRRIVPRGNCRGISEVRAMTRDIGAARSVPRRLRAARDGKVRKCDRHGFVEMPRRKDGRGNHVTARARDWLADRRRFVMRMRGSGRPRIGSGSVTCAARSVSISQVDASVHVERPTRKRRPVRIRFGMTARARAREVIGRRRAVTAVARQRRRVRPLRSRIRSAYVMTRYGTCLVRRIVARLGRDT